jgi:mRNA-degrading endonuclease RelE of RelBE toxin-antitoxin system
MHEYLILPHFKKQLKQLSKKYRHLKDEIIVTLEAFDKTQHQSLGNNLYKIRVKSKDIKRGKDKSFRLIVFIIEMQSYIVPITIYYKGDRKDISAKEVNDHLEIILLETKFFGM